MALVGKIIDYFIDKDLTIPGFPRTKIKAVSDDNNVGLNVILDEMKVDTSNAKTSADNAMTAANNAMPKSGGSVFTGSVGYNTENANVVKNTSYSFRNIAVFNSSGTAQSSGNIRMIRK